MPRAQVGRDDDVERLAQGLLRAETENPLAAGVPEADLALAVGVEHAVGRVGREAGKEFCAVHRAKPIIAPAQRQVPTVSRQRRTSPTGTCGNEAFTHRGTSPRVASVGVVVSDPEGLTPLRPRFTMREKSARPHLSPLPCRCGTLRGSLPATGRGWAHSPVSRGSDRRLEGERMARDPRGLTATVAVAAPAMARRAATADEAHGRPRLQGQTAAADLQRDTNRRHAGAARQPWGPAKVSGSPTGFPGRPAEAFRAGSDPALGCPCGARGPVAPPALHAGDGRRVRDERRTGMS